MKLHRTFRSVVALGLVAVVSAGVATVVAGADGSSNALEGARTVRVGASSPAESNFIGITPCRIVDTRQAGSGGRIFPTQTRSYRTQGSTGSQGGAATCKVPASATSLEINVTAANSTGNGFLRLFPAGGAEPTATFMNYTSSFNVSNAGTVAVTPGTAANLKVKAYGNSTDVIIEVLGYYVENMMAAVGGNGALFRGTAGATVSRDTNGQYRVNFNRSVIGCTFSGGLNDGGNNFGDKGYIAMAINGSSANGVYVETFNQAGTKTDLDFHVQVTC